ncbi:M14 family zinc carboxypeptidase [Portibacter marinus]|uniref:M14 family zinc carboxypeptidase n=1 Tax=Portibacter marinus TaxID=2898660 RepID=UPI001F43110F|nr:M14 family zinc carboxypeptidase [Portibacter marinus]
MRLLLMMALLMCVTTFFAQDQLLTDRFKFEDDLNYSSDIPSPADFLGYQLGEELTLYAHVEQYIKEVASLSERVDIAEYGETYEGRKLYRLVISSEENMQNIEDIRQSNLRIMDPVNHPDVSIEDAPVFMSFSYNIHGNETSSTEAAMQVIYRLAAANDEATLNMLQNAVTIIYPCINPDGRDRYVYWYKGSKRSVLGKEPSDLEHYAPWPNGRTNHYWFDLNRDWIWGVHPESRGHTAEYLRWMPHLHTDYHEMGYNSNYFTMPGTTPRNKLLPDDYEPLSDTIGTANIKAFNEYKVNYFTREAFDFFYPGYGSSYPSVLGAIGMLVEQGGISGGRAVESNDGYILTLQQRVYDHYRTSIATLAKAAERKEMFIDYSRKANDPANSKASAKAYVVKNNGNPYLDDFLRILNHHGVEVGRLQSDQNIQATSYTNGASQSTSFQSGDYVVSGDQNKHLFIHSVMGRTMEIEDSVMYDMSSWSLPIAYNLEAYEVFSNVNNVEDLEEMTQGRPSIVVDDYTYAVSIDWKQRHAPKALSMLLQKGYRVRVATESFTKDGQVNMPGTLILLVGRNLDRRDRMQDDLNEVAMAANVEMITHQTGRVEDGIDLASNSMRPINANKVAMLVGPPFNTYTSGQIYFLFDQETAYPIERIRTEVLSETAMPKFGQRYGLATIRDYDVIILPGGGGGLGQLLDEENQKEWKQWVQAGGILIAEESAASFLTKDNSKMTSVELLTPEKDTSKEVATLSFEDREKYFGHKRIPGTAVNSTVDTSHPLGFGLEPTVYTLKFSSDALKPSSALHSVIRYSDESDQILSAGFIDQDNIDLLTGNTSVGFLPMGRGGIVYLLDNPHYRMFWRGPSRVLQNAAFFLNR